MPDRTPPADTRPASTPPPPVPPPGARAPGDQPPAPSVGQPPASGDTPDTPSSGPGSSAPPRPGLDDRERALAPAIVPMWRITGALAWILPLGGLAVLAVLALDRFGWLVAATCLALFGLRVLWLPPVRYARWRWQLTALALELRYGVLVRQYEAVPYFRIQQIDITQGPIDRLLGLSTLVVTTASASGSATLPGISATDAPEVRAELLARATEAVAEHPGDLQDAV